MCCSLKVKRRLRVIPRNKWNMPHLNVTRLILHLEDVSHHLLSSQSDISRASHSDEKLHDIAHRRGPTDIHDWCRSLRGYYHCKCHHNGHRHCHSHFPRSFAVSSCIHNENFFNISADQLGLFDVGISTFTPRKSCIMSSHEWVAGSFIIS